MTIELIISISFSICLIATILFETRRSGEFVTPFILLVCFSIVDVFIPLGYFAFNGVPDHPYIPKYSIDAYARAALIYFVFIYILYLGYLLVTPKPYTAVQREQRCLSLFKISTYRFSVIYVSTVSLLTLNLFLNSDRFGSFNSYLLVKSKRYDYGIADELSGFFEKFFVHFEGTLIYIHVILTFILVYHARVRRNKNYYTVFLVIIGYLPCLLTFQKGTQLNYFIGLYLVLYLASIERRSIAGEKLLIPIRINLPVTLLGLAGVFAFTAYGALRNYSHDVAFGIAGSRSVWLADLARFIRGEGLIGLTWIDQSYDSAANLLMGKTYFDMLLLPIPRVFYTNKPSWYGVSDITRGIGGPSTTQDAVTMPGEIIANFGIEALFLAILWGLLFGLIYRFRWSTRFKIVYAAIVFQVVSVSAWMSYTGFTNSMKNILIYIIIVNFIYRKKAKIVSSTLTSKRA